MKKNNITITNPELLKEWNCKKNNELGINPEDYTSGSNKKVWWKCSAGHEWEATINNRACGNGCPYCLGKKGFNNLLNSNPELTVK